MYNIKALKKRVKEAANEVQTEEGSNNYIKAIIEFFDTPIDTSRISDYEVTHADIEKAEFELKDKKTGTVYGFCSDEQKNTTIITSPTYRISKFYFPCYDRMCYEDIVINEGEDSLWVTRINTENDEPPLTKVAPKLQVSYAKRHKGEKKEYEVLLRRVCSEKGYGNIRSYEKVTNNPFRKSFDKEIAINKYTYYLDNSVVHNIKDYGRKNHFNIEGVCLERTDIDIDLYCPQLPFGANIDDPNYVSAMYFCGSVLGNHHMLRITKNKDKNISIQYRIYEQYKEGKEDTIINIPTTNSDSITPEEIKTAINSLADNYNEFIDLAADELLAFCDKIDIRKGNIPEDLDDLDPKVFRNKPIEEIAKIISSNKEYYFGLMRSQEESVLKIPSGREKVLKES